MSNSQRCFASLNMTSGASLMDICIGQSKLSVQMKYLGFLWRVLRQLVWETATDTTTGLAAQMAYLLLFALAPGSLFLWHLLGLFGTDPTKLHRMFLLLKSFMPPDPKVQDILDSAMANVVVTGSSGLLANAGIILGIYFGTVFIATTSRALSHTYGMREDPHWWSKYITSFFMLFWFGIIIVFCFNAIVFGERLAGLAEVNFQLAFPLQAWIATLNLPFTFVALVILALALYLLTPENYLTVRQACPARSSFRSGGSSPPNFFNCMWRDMIATTRRISRWPPSSCCSLGCISLVCCCCWAVS